MFEDDIRIRLAETGMAFIYSIVRAGSSIETSVVDPVKEADDYVAPGYYGGSQVMD